MDSLKQAREMEENSEHEADCSIVNDSLESSFNYHGKPSVLSAMTEVSQVACQRQVFKIDLHTVLNN